MRSLSALPITMIAATGMFLGTSAVSGQEPATDSVVRVTDGAPPASNTTSAPAGGTATADAVVEGDVSYGGECSGEYSDRTWCGLVQNGQFVPPDSGWTRPIKYPIRRMPVQYYSYWPARWYGEPGSGIAPNAPRFPVVYTPTDTTQLGMYYQRVPQWLPNPAMIPPPPWPTDWHNRQARGYGSGAGCGPRGSYAGTTEAATPAEYTTRPQPQTQSQPQRIQTQTPQQPSAQPLPTPPAPIETDVQPPGTNGVQAPGRVRL